MKLLSFENPREHICLLFQHQPKKSRTVASATKTDNGINTLYVQMWLNTFWYVLTHSIYIGICHRGRGCDFRDKCHRNQLRYGLYLHLRSLMIHLNIFTGSLTLRSFCSRCGPRAGPPHTIHACVRLVCAEKGMASSGSARLMFS